MLDRLGLAHCGVTEEATIASETATSLEIGESGHRSEMIEMDGGAVHLLRGGDGPPLLYLHGGGIAGTWLPLHGFLAERYDVVAPDHPGFGRSDDLPLVQDIHDLVYHYLELMDVVGLERPAVVGTSFGGWLAAELAVHSPERIAELVLVAPVGLRIPEHPVTDFFILPPARKAEVALPRPVLRGDRVPGRARCRLHPPALP